jgi:hypothetical protein
MSGRNYRINRVHGLHEESEGCDKSPACAHPVVIDPEDAEQVERLAEALDVAFRKVDPEGWANANEGTDEEGEAIVRAALREFARPTPPKPEEPTGLGAVVEDAEGEVWVRLPDPPDADWNLDKPWRGGAGFGTRRHWQIVDAVRVLSEGVQA